MEKAKNTVEVKASLAGAEFNDASVSFIYVKSGDSVVKDAELMELTTDKSVIVVSAPCDGSVSEICVVNDQDVSLDTILCVIKRTSL